MKRKRHLLLPVLSLLFLIVSAQSTFHELPAVTIDDLKTTACPIDAEASAQIINKTGEISFFKDSQGLNVQFVVTERIQVFREDAFDKAEISIFYYTEKGSDPEKIEYFEAAVYTLEGDEIVSTTVDKKSLMDERVNDLYSRKKYAFPNLRPGSIVEYSYRLVSPYFVHLHDWEFQEDIPVLESHFKIALSPYASYNVIKSGYLKFDKELNYQKSFDHGSSGNDLMANVYDWTIYNVPAFSDVPFITTPDDFIMRVRFQLDRYYPSYGPPITYARTWDQLIDQLLKSNDQFGGYLKESSSKVQKELETLDDKSLDEVARMNTIVMNFRKNYVHNGYYGPYTRQKKQEVIESHSGNIAELNLLLTSLLIEAGYEAYPVLISTRSHGVPSYAFPMLNEFNYVAVVVILNGNAVLIDGTDELLPVNLLPRECINGYALCVKDISRKEEAAFYPLLPSVSASSRIQLLTTLKPDSTLIHHRVSARYGGYVAHSMRKQARKSTDNLTPFLTPDVATNVYHIETTNLDDTENPLVVRFEQQRPMDVAGTSIIVKPFPVKGWEENPLNEDKREYPVDFGTTYDDYISNTIQIPEGFEVDYIPGDMTLDTLDGSLQFRYLISKQIGMVQCLTQVRQSKTLYSSEDYGALKAFYDKVYEKMNDAIILKLK